jgi:hypothetical protein
MLAIPGSTRRHVLVDKNRKDLLTWRLANRVARPGSLVSLLKKYKNNENLFFKLWGSDLGTKWGWVVTSLPGRIIKRESAAAVYWRLHQGRTRHKYVQSYTVIYSAPEDSCSVYEHHIHWKIPIISRFFLVLTTIFLSVLRTIKYAHLLSTEERAYRFTSAHVPKIYCFTFFTATCAAG